jgi:hypothetical protein
MSTLKSVTMYRFVCRDRYFYIIIQVNSNTHLTPNLELVLQIDSKIAQIRKKSNKFGLLTNSIVIKIEIGYFEYGNFENCNYDSNLISKISRLVTSNLEACYFKFNFENGNFETEMG